MQGIIDHVGICKLNRPDALNALISQLLTELTGALPLVRASGEGPVLPPVPR